MVNTAECADTAPREFRHMVRRGEWTGSTAGVCSGYAPANLAIVPKDLAFEFFLFCFRNWQACPIIEVTEPGNPHPRSLATDADLRTDVPKYRVFTDGELVDEPSDIADYWRNDLVSFLVGCSQSLDWALHTAKVKFRRLGVFTSNIKCKPGGSFRGPMAVTFRLIKGSRDLIRTVQISSQMPAAHGAPVHIGDPTTIGIKDIYHADLVPGQDVAPQEPDEIPVIWGCGVTAELAALRAKPPLMITHKGGHMFVTDQPIQGSALV